MPMGMPITVSELAEFLLRALDDAQPERDGDVASDSDVFDWSLKQWRAYKLKTTGEKQVVGSRRSGSADRGVEDVVVVVVLFLLLFLLLLSL